jgi:hypothetical protein
MGPPLTSFVMSTTSSKTSSGARADLDLPVDDGHSAPHVHVGAE